MCFLGIVRNGHVELPPEAKLPDGTQVRVEVPDSGDPMDHLEDLAIDGLPADMASRHDRYIYGVDKQND